MAWSPAGQPCTVSISHSEALVAVAVGHDVPVGVDAEAAPLPGDWQLDSVFTVREAAAIAQDPTGRTARMLWARKEALLKLAGVGLNGPVSEADVSEVPAAGGFVDGPCPGWLVDIDVGDTASVAAAMAEPPTQLDVARFSASTVAELLAGATTLPSASARRVG